MLNPCAFIVSRKRRCAWMARFHNSSTSFSPNEEASPVLRYGTAMRWPTLYGYRFIIRKAFLRRVTTRWAASSPDRAASERKSGFGFSCSKYSTRHGHQSASISAFGNCIRSFKLDARLQIVCPKSSGFSGSADQQKIAFAVAPSAAGGKQFFRLAVQLRNQSIDLVIGDDERIELPRVPIRSRLRRLEKLRAPNIQKHSLFFSADDAIMPAMRRCFQDHRASENGEGVPLFVIRRRDFPRGVT